MVHPRPIERLIVQAARQGGCADDNAVSQALADAGAAGLGWIDAVLDAPRAETRTLAVSPQTFALRPLLDDTLALVRFALADARGVTIDATLPDDAPSLCADRERIAQALWTMLTVAVEASAAGSRVTFACTREGAHYVVRVLGSVDAAALVDPALPHMLESFARRAMRSGSASAWCRRIASATASCR